MNIKKVLTLMISAFIAVNIAAADTYAATDPVTREEVSDTATAKLDSV